MDTAFEFTRNFLGNLVQFKKICRLSDEIFYDNITRSLANIDYMSKTMDTFKNFYKINKNVQSFDILSAIKDVIAVLFPNDANTIVKITIARNTDTMCENHLNEFKQIIACLIQNSKQALQNKKRGRIVIHVTQTKTHFVLRIMDNGCVVDKSSKDSIFAPFSSTKGSSGLGLYISKLIANKKCGGDLNIQKYAHPTIFALNIVRKVSNDK